MILSLQSLLSASWKRKHTLILLKGIVNLIVIFSWLIINFVLINLLMQISLMMLKLQILEKRLAQVFKFLQRGKRMMKLENLQKGGNLIKLLIISILLKMVWLVKMIVFVLICMVFVILLLLFTPLV